MWLSKSTFVLDYETEDGSGVS